MDRICRPAGRTCPDVPGKCFGRIGMRKAAQQSAILQEEGIILETKRTLSDTPYGLEQLEYIYRKNQ